MVTTRSSGCSAKFKLRTPEDLLTLRATLTPELLSYFSEELAANASRGVINRFTDVKLIQGDLAEAWREGRNDHATARL